MIAGQAHTLSAVCMFGTNVQASSDVPMHPRQKRQCGALKFGGPKHDSPVHVPVHSDREGLLQNCCDEHKLNIASKQSCAWQNESSQGLF